MQKRNSWANNHTHTQSAPAPERRPCALQSPVGVLREASIQARKGAGAGGKCVLWSGQTPETRRSRKHNFEVLLCVRGRMRMPRATSADM